MLAHVSMQVSDLAVMVAKLTDRVSVLESETHGIEEDGIPGVDLAGNPVRFG